MRNLHSLSRGAAQAALPPVRLIAAAASLALLSPPAAADNPLAFAGARQAAPAIPVGAKHGMAVTAQHLASEVGAHILAEGGNAADAAVAVAYALAVVLPAAGNIGGGGFMTLMQPNGHADFIDFREHAPLAATSTMYQDAQGRVIPGLSLHGWKAIGVPGTVAGMNLVLRTYGTMTRAKVMAPAIKLARDGFVLGPLDVALLHTSTAAFKADPAAAKIFLRHDGTPYEVGDRLVQTDLAHTLEAISKHGDSAFYSGPVARSIVDGSKRGGGILSMRDFTAYQARVMKPVSCAYHGLLVDTAPPPSGGGVALCEMLNILSGDDLHGLGYHTGNAVQREIEAMRRAYADRQDLGDPRFVHDPVAHLTSTAYAAAVRRVTPTDRALATRELPAASDEKPQTTHYSVIDQHSQAVSVTYTLNGWFGAGVVAAGTGVMLNDEMDDFSSKPGSPNMFGLIGSQANAIAPGKTPLSSMAPTILSRNGRAVMVIGSPGGSRIPTIILSVILGVVDYGQTIQQAIDDGRIHEQWMPQPVEVEPGALSPSVIKTLTGEGYRFKQDPPWGSAEGILVGAPAFGAAPSDGDRFYGGIDRRHPGAAAVGE